MGLFDAIDAFLGGGDIIDALDAFTGADGGSVNVNDIGDGYNPKGEMYQKHQLRIQGKVVATYETEHAAEEAKQSAIRAGYGRANIQVTDTKGNIK